MSDLFGFNETREFKDIPNQQDKAAEEKAMLCLKLKVLVFNVPESVRSGSVQATRKWVDAQNKAKKVLAKKTSSRSDLQREITIMEQYK